MVKKIALEEHFIDPATEPYWRPTMVDVAPAKTAQLYEALTSFGEQRLAMMDKTGIARAVLAIAGPGVQVERDTATGGGGIAIGVVAELRDADRARQRHRTRRIHVPHLTMVQRREETRHQHATAVRGHRDRTRPRAERELRILGARRGRVAAQRTGAGQADVGAEAIRRHRDAVRCTAITRRQRRHHAAARESDFGATSCKNDPGAAAGADRAANCRTFLATRDSSYDRTGARADTDFCRVTFLCRRCLAGDCCRLDPIANTIRAKRVESDANACSPFNTTRPPSIADITAQSRTRGNNGGAADDHRPS